MAPRKTPRVRTRRTDRGDARNVNQDLEQSQVEAKAEGDENSVPTEEQEVWDSVREEQYEVIEQLPLTLHRMFTLLRELDDRYTSLVAELQEKMRKYIALRQAIAGQSVSSPSRPVNNPNQDPRTAADTEMANGTAANTPHPEVTLIPKVEQTTGAESEISQATSADTTTSLLQRIAWLNAESVRTSEEKLALATTAYDLVDRHVRSLDLSIKAEEAAFTIGLRPGTMPVNSVMQNGANGSGGLGMKSSDQTVLTGGTASRPRSRNKPRKPRPADAEPLQPPPQSPSVDANGISLVRQQPSMAVDPNEPRYCYCGQVSYGEMIACDNDDCDREWFHYGCVGLTEAPKQRWFCDDCKIALGIVPRERKRKHA